MATVNKDFKIKSGLVVEGTTGTINGNSILTENASDAYIINLIGGETLVTSVDSNQLEVVNGELTVKSGVFDGYGAADDALNSANNYTNGEVSSAVTTAQNYADSLASNYDPAGSAQGAYNNATSYADTAASAAENNAKTYADNLIDDASNLSTEVWSAYKTSIEIGLAQSAAETFATQAVSNLVDGAPALLDTLNELAAALQDNPDVIQNIQDVAAGKQDTLTAGSNIDITGATISVTGLDSGDISDFSTAALSATASAYDASGAAATAENDANNYTDQAINALNTDAIEEGLGNLYFTNQRALDAAAQLLTQADTTNITINGTGNGLTIVAENGVADSTTDDLDEGSTNLYFTNTRAVSAITNADIEPTTVTIDAYRKEEATQQYVAAASTVDVHSFGYPNESAKYLVRVVGWVGGVKHSQMSEILVTVDGNDNIAITEYGTIYTDSNPLATFSARVDNTGSTRYVLTATTAGSGFEVIAAATLLSWAD